MNQNDVDQIRGQLQAAIPTFAYFYRSGETWRAAIDDMTVNPDDVDDAFRPSYYAKSGCDAFVRVRDFVRLEDGWPSTHLALWSRPDDRSGIRGALRNQNSPVRVVELLDRNIEPAFWWVNQGATYEHQKAGSYLWAPKSGVNGVTFQHWSNVSEVKSSDVVIHYANNAMRAISQVIAEPEEAPKPSELQDENWGDDGWLAKVSRYWELDPPIQRAEIPADWRTQETTGPFTVDGNVKQGYLFPISSEFVRKLISRFEREWPAFMVPADGQILHSEQIWSVLRAELTRASGRPSTRSTRLSSPEPD